MSKDSKTPEDDNADFNRLTIRLLSFGSNIAVGMISLFWLGTYLDKKFDAGDKYSTYGVLLAIIYCGYQIFKVARENNND